MILSLYPVSLSLLYCGLLVLLAVCFRYYWGLDLLGLGLSVGLFRVIRIVRIARAAENFNVIRGSTFIAFGNGIRTIITLNE